MCHMDTLYIYNLEDFNMSHSVWSYLQQLPTEKLKQLLNENSNTLLPEIVAYVRFLLVQRQQS